MDNSRLICSSENCALLGLDLLGTRGCFIVKCEALHVEILHQSGVTACIVNIGVDSHAECKVACVAHGELGNVAGANLALLIARGSFSNQSQWLVENGLEALLDVLSALCLQILGHLEAYIGATEHESWATGVQQVNVLLSCRHRQSLDHTPRVEIVRLLAVQDVAPKHGVLDVLFVVNFAVLAIGVRIRQVEVAKHFCHSLDLILHSLELTSVPVLTTALINRVSLHECLAPQVAARLRDSELSVLCHFKILSIELLI